MGGAEEKPALEPRLRTRNRALSKFFWIKPKCHNILYFNDLGVKVENKIREDPSLINYVSIHSLIKKNNTSTTIALCSPLLNTRKVLESSRPCPTTKIEKTF